jgi:hypothetical protein
LLTLLFINLWCLADREGRLEDRPLRIKAETFPYRENIDINRYLTELERLGFIHRYSVDSVGVIQVIKFCDHQSPHHTEKGSTLPSFNSQLVEYTEEKSLVVKQPLINGELTVQERSDSLIPDSLIPDSLIPDSLIPETGKKKKINKKEISRPDDVDERTWGDFLVLRKTKRAPVTDTAINGIRKESEKAGISLNQALEICCQNGWQGFKAEWHREQQTKIQSQKNTKFSGYDYLNGGDGYGNKREANNERIINGELAVNLPKIQG